MSAETKPCTGDFEDLLLALHDPDSGMGSNPEGALAVLGRFVAHDAAWLVPGSGDMKISSFRIR